MIDKVTQINGAVNSVVWGVPALTLLIGTGNISGIAYAITMGGPGSGRFWLYCSPSLPCSLPSASEIWGRWLLSGKAFSM